MPNKGEHRLTPYHRTNGMTTRLTPTTDSGERLALGIRGGFKIACAEVLRNDPTADAIWGVPDSLEQAKGPLHRPRDLISAEMPHRLPQSGRMGRLGTAVSFVDG